MLVHQILLRISNLVKYIITFSTTDMSTCNAACKYLMVLIDCINDASYRLWQFKRAFERIVAIKYYFMV